MAIVLRCNGGLERGDGEEGRRSRRQEDYQLFLCIDMNINNRGSATRGQARRRTQSAWLSSLPPSYMNYISYVQLFTFYKAITVHRHGVQAIARFPTAAIVLHLSFCTVSIVSEVTSFSRHTTLQIIFRICTSERFPLRPFGTINVL